MAKPFPIAFGSLVEHASTGFKMPEAVARKIDDLAKSSNLPKDFGYRRLAKSTSDLKCDPGERTDISTITTDSVDRDGEVVIPDGGDWSQYNKIVAFAHDYSQLPVGSNWWMKSKGNGIIAKTHYPNKPADWDGAPWLPSAILHLMQQPVPTCTGKSIGFLPLHIRSATAQEKAVHPDWSDAPVIDKWSGLEYSVVGIGSNPDALMEAVSKGIKDGVFDAQINDLMSRYVESEKTIVSMSGAKAMSEAANQDGGTVVPDSSMPDCPTCKCNEGVKLMPPAPGESSPFAQYNCAKCGSNFQKKDDDMGGMDMDAVDPNLVAGKTVEPTIKETTFGDAPSNLGAVEDPDRDGDVDPIIYCPFCREKATLAENITIPGIGQCDKYTCPGCGQYFIQPESQTPNPNMTGVNNGTGTQTFMDQPTPKESPEPEAKVSDKPVEPWWDEADLESAKLRRKAELKSIYVKTLIPTVVEAIETRLGRV